MKQSALARLALLALIWGSAFLWIKLAIRGFSPVEVTFLRLALGAAVLFPIMLARREALPRSARMWTHITVAALFANAVPYLLFAIAEQTVDSSTAGIINATTPLWTVLLAPAVRHQKSVTGWQAAGLIVKPLWARSPLVTFRQACALPGRMASSGRVIALTGRHCPAGASAGLSRAAVAGSLSGSPGPGSWSAR